MSSLLEKAIVDAKALKEAAVKNAQEEVLNRYHEEVKEAVDQFLRTEEEFEPSFDLGAEDGLSMDAAPEEEASSVVDDLPASHEYEEATGKVAIPVQLEEEYVDIDLAALMQEYAEEDVDEVVAAPIVAAATAMAPLAGLQRFVAQAAEKLGLPTPPTDSIDDIKDYADEYGIDLPSEEEMAESTEEDADITEEVLDQIAAALAEELDSPGLTVDVEPVLPGAIGGNQALEAEAEDFELAHQRDEKFAEEKKELEKSVSDLAEQNENLTEKIKNYKSVVGQLKDKLEEINLSNAKMVYMNRVLSDNSLNERQKTKLVDALREADSIGEAKSIYETLKSVVGSNQKKSQRIQSLAEVKAKPSPFFAANGKPEEKKSVVFERLQKLAGIQDK